MYLALFILALTLIHPIFTTKAKNNQISNCEVGNWKYLTIKGKENSSTTDENNDYQFKVSGSLKEWKNEDNKDKVTKNKANSQIHGGEEKFKFTGDLVEMNLPYHAAAYVSRFPCDIGDKVRLWKYLTIKGKVHKNDIDSSDYYVRSRGEIKEWKNNNSEESNKKELKGNIKDDEKSFKFMGEIEDMKLPQHAAAYISNTPCDLGVEYKPWKYISIKAKVYDDKIEDSHFTLKVSGKVQKWTKTENDDNISDNKVEGNIEEGIDGLKFTGDIEQLELPIHAAAYLKQLPDEEGEEIKQWKYLTIKGKVHEDNVDSTDYSIKVGGEIQKYQDSNPRFKEGNNKEAQGKIKEGEEKFKFIKDIEEMKIPKHAAAYISDDPNKLGEEYKPWNYLTLKGNVYQSNFNEKEFKITTTGKIKILNKDDDVEKPENNSVKGTIEEGTYKFKFKGEVSETKIPDNSALYVSQLPDEKGEEIRKWNYLVIKGKSHSDSIDSTEYSFKVSGELKKHDKTGSSDQIKGNEANGTIGGSEDHYKYTGEIKFMNVPYHAGVYVYDDPKGEGEDISLPKYLTLSGGNSSKIKKKDYHIKVSGSIQGHNNLNPSEKVQENVANGKIDKGTDQFKIKGKIKSIKLPKHVKAFVSYSPNDKGKPIEETDLCRETCRT